MSKGTTDGAFVKAYCQERTAFLVSVYKKMKYAKALRNVSKICDILMRQKKNINRFQKYKKKFCVSFTTFLPRYMVSSVTLLGYKIKQEKHIFLTFSPHNAAKL